MDVAEFPQVPGVKILRSKMFEDHRGMFLESYREVPFAQDIGSRDFVQGNVSVSKKGVLRGLHYQVRNPQGKLMRCVHGKSFNVALDMRANSESFGRTVGAWLLDAGDAIWIPPGFAAGFYAAEDDTTIVYECTTYHQAEHDRAVRFDSCGIPWPFEDAPVISTKDLNAPLLADAEQVPECEWR